MEQNQASNGAFELIQSHNGSHCNDRRVGWSIVLVEQHTFTDFPTAFDLNIFS